MCWRTAWGAADLIVVLWSMLRRNVRVAKLNVRQQTASRTINSLNKESVELLQKFVLLVGATFTPSLAFAANSSAEILD
jgi:hypothetical protein